ncbi:uncharacterized protein [Pempheris klunzingeri]|uniref:uncharacterized protein n=1 Tax=Pempheris klunzingeri TaxID=3127111 RepID=UPI0039805F51
MMETKLWISQLLLLVNLGSALNDEHHVVTSSAPKSTLAGEAPPQGPIAESGPASSQDPTSHAATAPPTRGPDANPSSRVTSTLSSDTVSPTPKTKAQNDTNMDSPSETAVSEQNRNLTDQLTSQPPSPPAASHVPTTHTPPTSTTTSPTHTAHTAPAGKPTTTPSTNTSHQAALPVSITPSNQPSHPKTNSSTSVPTSDPPKQETTTTTTTTTAVTRSSSTSSTSSSPKPPSSTLTTPQHTSQPGVDPDNASAAHTKSTPPKPSSPSAQAEAHDNPSQLNVGGGTTMVHESSTLDPLLAGLVSAFIITAVIITLLLFLKLRRRDNRPEFRRLQDLPMDDMMEDTPLSMYSY